MNDSIDLFCFALNVQLVAGRAKAKLLFFYVCFVLLTNASYCIHLSKDKNGHVILNYFYRHLNAVFLT